MILAATDIKAVDERVRWASVYVYDRKTNELLAEYRITAEEEAALREKGVLPSVITREVWETCLVVCAGRYLEPGQALKAGNGSLIVSFGEHAKARAEIAQLFPGEWEEDASGVVRVRSDKADELTRKWRGRGRRV